MSVFVQLIIIWAIFTLIFYMGIVVMQRRIRMRKRIHSILSSTVVLGKAEKEDQNRGKNQWQIFISSLSKVFYGLSFRKTERLLNQAGSSLRPEEFLVWRILMIGGTASLLLIAGAAWYKILVLCTMSFVMPKVYMNHRRVKRLQLLSYQLVETLGMMANAMRAGFSFLQAMQMIARDIPAPIGPEFERVVQEISRGVPVEEALRSLTVRLPNKDLEVIVEAILTQRTSGGNLTSLFETIEETVRGRVRVAEELRTLTAQGKLSAWVVTLLPISLALYFAAFSPDYFWPMLDHPLGWLLLGVSAISIALGWYFIQKIVRIEV